MFYVHPIKHISFPNYTITSFCGIPFYQSSGESSGYPGTWFPFCGILEQDDIFYKTGFYLKPEEHNLPSDVRNEMAEHFPSYGSYDQGRQLLIRFSTLSGLWISSQLGGGLWEDPRGKQLLKFLQSHYFKHYPNLPSLKLLPIAFESGDIKEINRWLCQHAQVDNYDNLKDKLFQSLRELSLHLELMERDKNQKKLIILACSGLGLSVFIAAYTGLTMGAMLLLAIQVAFLAYLSSLFKINPPTNWLPAFKSFSKKCEPQLSNLQQSDSLICKIGNLS